MNTPPSVRTFSECVRRTAGIALGALALLLAACTTTLGSDRTPATSSIGLYEIRTYTVAPGKMAELDARFREHTISLFRRHGMLPIGFFHVATAPGQPEDNRLIYLMGYKDRVTRDNAWSAFAADPEWRQVYKTSEANGSLLSKAPESTFLTPADYSPVLNLKHSGKPRHFELRTYTVMPGRLDDLHARFRNHTLRIFAKHGMTSILYWRPTPDQPSLAAKMLYMLAYPDQAARNASWSAFSADPEWKKVSDDSQKTGPMLVSPGGVVSVQLTPTDYSPLR